MEQLVTSNPRVGGASYISSYDTDYSAGSVCRTTTISSYPIYAVLGRLRILATFGEPWVTLLGISYASFSMRRLALASASGKFTMICSARSFLVDDGIQA